MPTLYLVMMGFSPSFPADLKFGLYRHPLACGLIIVFPGATMRADPGGTEKCLLFGRVRALRFTVYW